MTDNSFGEELGQLPPDLTLGATSDQIMRRGRRIRTIRQGSIAGLAALAVVGIVSSAAVAGTHHGTRVGQTGSGGGDGIGLSGPASAVASPVPAVSTVAAPASSPAPAAPVASASSVPTSSCSPAPQVTTGAPPAPQNFDLNQNPQPWGSLINVGTDSNGLHVVLYGYHIDDAVLPCTHFGLMLGTRDPATGATSGVTGMVAANEFSGSDLTPGMHAVSLSGGGNQINAWYLIGYYVGPAAAVSVDEKAFASPVAATVVPWSVNPDVKFWWVSGTGAVPTLGAFSAKDAVGNALPIGNHAQPGVG